MEKITKKDVSIFEIENCVAVAEYMKTMKVIMIKGIGYFVVSKDAVVNSDTMLNLALVMEARDVVV